MAKEKKYFKLGKVASVFYDIPSHLKVAGNVPGVLSGNINPHIRDAMAKGHIIEIKEDEYDEMMEAHGENKTANDEATAKKIALRKKGKVDPAKEAKEAAEKEEEEEAPEPEDEDDDEEDEKPKKKKGRKK